MRDNDTPEPRNATEWPMPPEAALAVIACEMALDCLQTWWNSEDEQAKRWFESIWPAAEAMDQLKQMSNVVSHRIPQVKGRD